MKLAVSTYSLWRWGSEQKKKFEQSLDWIRGAGVDAVEFVGAGPDADDIVRRAAALRRRCGKAGLNIVSYCVGAELLVPPAKQREVVDRLKRDVDVAAALGAPTMRHDVTRG